MATRLALERKGVGGVGDTTWLQETLPFTGKLERYHPLV